MPIELTAPVDVVMNTLSPGLIAPGEIVNVTPSSATRTLLATAVVAVPDTGGVPTVWVSGPVAPRRPPGALGLEPLRRAAGLRSGIRREAVRGRSRGVAHDGGDTRCAQLALQPRSVARLWIETVTSPFASGCTA